MTAYYNEIDPFAAQWLRNLIAGGVIASGVVDQRSIIDVQPEDLREFAQCHFFAGIGVWSHALRQAGWPDDSNVWTGSCPCQPFSAAGGSLGLADERHLWPAWFNLIIQRQPSHVFGEQVSSAAGLEWFDVVQADMESAAYATTAADLCAAGVGAPHIRQRLFFAAARLGDPFGDGLEGRLSGWPDPQWPTEHRQARPVRAADGLANTHGGIVDGSLSHWQGGRPEPADSGSTGGPLDTGLANADVKQHPIPESQRRDARLQGARHKSAGAAAGRCSTAAGSPTNGWWRSADWLFCKDGKWRPVEPGAFPLVDGTTSRVGRLRAYGNAISGPLATEFIKAYMETIEQFRP